MVYEARDNKLGHRVALKVLRGFRPDDARSRERLRREAAIARRVNHPNLVRVFDYGETDETAYLSMELVEGESLSSRLSSERLSVDEALEISLQLAQGLSHLHDNGCVHRDVKPSNVLLSRDGTAKLSDFGLSLVESDLNSRLTSTGALVGTLEYLAPEQALGEAATPRSDLYSLGIVMYEMLVGEPPLRAATPFGSVLGRLARRPHRADQFRPEVPAWLARAVDRLLERRARDRYPDARTLINDLENGAASYLTTRSRKVMAAGVAAMAAAVLIFLGTRDRRPPSQEQAVRLTSGDDGGMAVRNRHGKVLWSDRNVTPARGAVLARLPSSPQEPRVLSIDRSPGYNRQLKVRVGSDGRVHRVVVLPNGHDHFPSFSDSYEAFIDAVDIDADGFDEILVTYLSTLDYPSYTVLWEPELDRTRIVFAGSGHHHFADLVDIGGDGHLDLVLVGLNNRMGWMKSVVGVELDPPVGRGSPTASEVPFQTPDRHLAPQLGNRSWNALFPPDICVQKDCLVVSPDRSRLVVGGEQGVRLLANGLRSAVGAESSDASRLASRRSAITQFRLGRRAMASGSFQRARVAFLSASQRASESGSNGLAVWTEVEAARARLLGGDLTGASLDIESMLARGSLSADGAYVLGCDLYRVGEHESSHHWLRVALELNSRLDKTLPRIWEYLVALVVVGHELDMPLEALDEVGALREHDIVHRLVIPFSSGLRRLARRSYIRDASR